jgi:hypothetical protein
LVRVHDAAGYFYTNVFDKWTGMLDQRRVCAFVGDTGVETGNYQAAFREGGGLSIAALARISTWKKSGDFSPSDYLSAAESGFAHLQQNGPSYCDDGKENIIDDYAALLAATELFAATSTPSYLDAARVRASALTKRLSPAGYFIADDGSRPFWHGSDAGLPVVALVRYLAVETDAAHLAEAKTTIAKHLAYLVSVTGETNNPYGYARQTFNTGGMAKTGFFIPHDNETGYWWQGENARLASLAAAAFVGGRVVDEPKPGYQGISPALEAYAAAQLDWIVGKNPYDASFMTGYGRNNPPAYSANRAPYQFTTMGGISNGITGNSNNVDGSGIDLNPSFPAGSEWMNWRWVEQWIPHATWYLYAVTVMTE